MRKTEPIVAVFEDGRIHEPRNASRRWEYFPTVSREQGQEILTAADRKWGPQSYSHMKLNPTNNVNEPGCHLFLGSSDKRSGWLSPWVLACDTLSRVSGQACLEFSPTETLRQYICVVLSHKFVLTCSGRDGIPIQAEWSLVTSAGSIRMTLNASSTAIIISLLVWLCH